MFSGQPKLHHREGGSRGRKAVCYWMMGISGRQKQQEFTTFFWPRWFLLFGGFLALSCSLALFGAFAQIIYVFPKFFSYFCTLSPDDLPSRSSLISSQKPAASLSLASTFLRKNSLIISIWCPTGIIILKCLKPNWPLSSQMCFFSEVPWSHRCNSLYLLSWRSNRKVVFEISSAYRFSHIGAFLVLYHYVSWIYHFFFGFVDLGVQFMSTTITRFLDGGS